LLECRQAWGDKRVIFRDDTGGLARVPLSWTSLAPSDSFVIIAAGRAHFRPDDLRQLADLLARLDIPQRDPAAGKQP
jgi:hypothetical protein